MTKRLNGSQLIIVMLTALLMIAIVRYELLMEQVDTACSGVVASLDLTEWVDLCND